MKLDALEHPKVLHFATLLSVSLPTALGHLELLWAFTGKFAAQGDIGKHPDGAIARYCHWMGEPQTFLQSLLQSRLLDAHRDHRYVVHDWAEHAPRWVRAKLAKLKMEFVGPAEPTADDSVDRSVVDTAEASTQGREGKGREERTTLELVPTEEAAEKRSPRRGTRVPEPFVVTPALRAWAAEKYPSLDVDAATEDFTDYWKGQAGQKGVMLDWEATWRTSMRKVHGWGRFQKQGGGSDPNRGIEYR